MGDTTGISWTDDPEATGRKLGAQKSAAKKAGCSVTEWRARRAAGERWCYRCRIWKGIVDFAKDVSRTGGVAGICKPCNNIRSTRCRYGLSEDDFARLQAVGACPICERSGVPMEVDHNHRTGAVRAILCSRCNSALGMFWENVSIMQRAIAYLEVHADG